MGKTQSIFRHREKTDVGAVDVSMPWSWLL